MRKHQNEWLQRVNNLEATFSRSRQIDERVHFDVDDDCVSYEVKATAGFGAEDVVLLEQDDNLLADQDDGYVVAPFLKSVAVRELRKGIEKMVAQILQDLGICEFGAFSLERYHRWVSTDAIHRDVLKHIENGITMDQFPIDKGLLEQRVSELCGVAVSSRSPHQGELFGFRIVRPMSMDHNPPHRDVWVPILRNAVNIYVPLAGSNERSSLPLMLGSHRLKESEIERTAPGAMLGTQRYPLPIATNTTRGMKLVRPPVASDEALIFLPYLIHGCGINRNTDATRVSLEMRFWRA